jgi:multidrug efflux pump subunit AcrB
VFLTQVQLPAGATLEQTAAVVAKVENYYLTEELATTAAVCSKVAPAGSWTWVRNTPRSSSGRKEVGLPPWWQKSKITI